LLCSNAFAQAKRPFDVQHIKLDVSFDFAEKKIMGSVSHSLKAVDKPLSIVELDAVGMTITGVTRSDRVPVTFSTTANKLAIDSSKPIQPNETVTFTVSYEAKPRTGLQFISDGPDQPARQIWSLSQPISARHWFPCYDAPDDKSTSEMIITVPQKFTALSNGKLVRTTSNEREGTKTFHWLQDKPHSSYLISLAVAEFVEVRDGDYKGKPILYYAVASQAERAREALKATPQMMKFFSEVTGFDYPWDKYATVVAARVPGGMENTSLTIIGDSLLTRQTSTGIGLGESVGAHELAHHWFGDLLTCKDWSHIWLNEGFATYFDLLFTEHTRGRETFLRRIVGTQNIGKLMSTSRRRPIVFTEYQHPMAMFDQNSYAKGACVLHMLRYTLGDDLWWKGIRHYVKKHAYQNVDTDDFRRAMEEATGRDLKWFFDQWLYKTGYPLFRIAWKWDEEKKVVTVTIQQTQTVTATVPVFRTPAELEFKTDLKSQRVKVEIRDSRHEFSFPLDDKPQSVAFDPDKWLLHDAKIEELK
jgi:aminopeptidase N